MGELNQQIQWVPEHVKDGSFGKWLANARDWSISRNRFWGSPIPVWRSDDPNYPRIDVYGSIADLERDFGVQVDDLHRPYVDNLVRPNPDDPTGRSTMRRVAEVLDCWFESGSMPFAQVHYPFENAGWFEDHYPGDFIVEYMAQTRGWFYTLHVLATALFDRPAFRTCISHGIVLGDDGQKMSKSLNNYPDPMMVFDTYGADAMRWYLLSSPILRGGDLAVTESGHPRERATHRAADLEHVLVLHDVRQRCRLHRSAPYGLVRSTRPVHPRQAARARHRRDDFDGCVRPVRRVRHTAHVPRRVDQLVRAPVARAVLGGRSRSARCVVDRADDDVPGCCAAAAVDHRGGVSRARRRRPPACTSPIGRAAPSSTESPSAGCRDGPRSRRVQRLVRGSQGRRTARPPATGQLDDRGTRCRISGAVPGIIADEVNVKDVVLSTDLDAVGAFELTVVPGVLGPRIGKDVQQVIVAVKKGEWTQDDEHRCRHGRRYRTPRRRVLASSRRRGSVAGNDTAGQHRRRRARHRPHPRARGRRCCPRSGEAGAAGPPRRRAPRQRSHRADARACPTRSGLRSRRSRR